MARQGAVMDLKRGCSAVYCFQRRILPRAVGWVGGMCTLHRSLYYLLNGEVSD